MNEEAASFVVQEFCRVWPAAICPVCGKEKWQKSPFCRACSIQLQRAHLYHWFRGMLGKPYHRHPRLLTLAIVLHWDRCKDFLVNRET